MSKSNSVSKFILLVDDNPTNLSVLSLTLKTAGYQVRVAIEGEAAIRLAEQTLPELILLDVQMPGIDGFETCARLKANPLTQKIPVIFMTALADTASKLKGLSLGAVDYIPKPFEQEEVLARVKIHWQLKQLTDSLEQQVMDQTALLKQTQVQLIQQEKLSILGQLVAGVAHEINNPLSFVASNIMPAKNYLADLTELLQLYQQEYPQPSSAVATQIDAIDLEFVLDDFPKILQSMELGVNRIKEISTSLRNFTRSDTVSRTVINLHEGLESTLLLLKHRLKEVNNCPPIEIIKQYGDLPLVECYPGPLNQAFMNLLANAIDALEEGCTKADSLSVPAPQITITTKFVNQQVVISIRDNGPGMTEDVRSRLFDPFFTTKPMGKGTGLGLSICHQIVTEKHQGQLECRSGLGKGAEFIITLPA